MATAAAPKPPPRRGLVRIGNRRAFLQDLYHFLLTTSWPRLVGLIVGLYLTTNVLFALAYLVGGDCVKNARSGSFSDMFFFSVQTMATIGYGDMAPATFYAHVLVTIEALAGMLWVAMATGLIFAKFSRPTARVLFSQVAVVSHWNGVPSLMFRMANERGNQIVEAQLGVVLARTERTLEGQEARRFYDLDLSRKKNAIFAFSWTAISPITPGSLLDGMDAASLAAMEAEIIVSVMGTDETLSQTVHARFSYGSDKILWGHKLVDVLLRLPDGRRAIDYNRFHDSEPATTIAPAADPISKKQ